VSSLATATARIDTSPISVRWFPKFRFVKTQNPRAPVESEIQKRQSHFFKEDTARFFTTIVKVVLLDSTGARGFWPNNNAILAPHTI